MTNPYETSKDFGSHLSSTAISTLKAPLAVVLLGALSSSILGGWLTYDGREGAIRFAISFSIVCFVVGSICSLIPAMKLRRRLVAGEADVDRVSYFLVALFCMPVATVMVMFVLLAAVVLIAVLTGNFSAT